MNSIAGAVALRHGVRLDVDAVSRMIEALQGRRWGPRRICGDQLAVLAHRQLGMPERGTESLQPATDPAVGTTIVLDGQLLNRDQLRRELADALHDGDTRDPRLILAAYTRWGEGFIERLTGEFSFVLADRAHRRVLMARDNLGIKPLYLARRRDSMLFASTLPALLASGGIDTTIDAVGLHHYLSGHAVVPPPHTILRGVEKLPPATLRVIDADGIRDRVYWQPSRTPGEDRAGWSSKEWTEATRSAVLAAVRRRLPEAGPVSVLLSGGLDSSLLVALLTDCHRGPINTFSIGFDRAGDLHGDEFAYSSMVSRRFGTHHHPLHVLTRDLVPAVVEAIEDMSEPMGSHEATAFHLLSRHVSAHTSTVLCGLGADEVFAGDLFHESTHLRTVDEPVARVDSMCRPWGLQASVPFLDREVVELAAGCPREIKLAHGGKGPLKELGLDLLPHPVTDRPKGRFPVPALTLLQGPLLDLVSDTLRSQRAADRGLVEPCALQTMLTSPDQTGHRAGGNTLWRLAVLEMWLQRHVDDDSARQLTSATATHDSG